MKKILFVLIAALLLVSCEKKSDPIPEVQFTLNVDGFNITTDDFGSLKSTEALFDGYEHKYTGGTLNFEAPSGAVYSFDTQDTPLDEFVFSLSPGTYSLTGESIPASYGGRDAMTYTIEAQDLTIAELTTSIDVIVTPNCGLILVSDALSQVSAAHIRSETVPPYYNFFTDDIFYYSYFEPRVNHWAEIIKLDASTLTIRTDLLLIGYIYQIEVTDAAGSMDFNITPTFTEAETVVW